MGAKNSTTLSNWVENNVAIKESVKVSVSARGSSVVIDTQGNKIVLNAYKPDSCCGNTKNTAEYTACLNAVNESANQTQGVCGGSVNITQVIGSKDFQTAKVDASMRANILQSISTTMDSQINDIVKQNNTGGILGSLLKLGDTNDTNVANHLKTSINVTLQDNLTTESINNIRNISGQNNNTDINICFGQLSAKDCNLSQDATLTVYQNNMVGSVANIVATNKDANTIYNGLKNSSNQSNNSFLGKLLGEISKTEKIIFGIIIVVAVIALLLALIWMAKGNKDDTPNLMNDPPPRGGFAGDIASRFGGGVASEFADRASAYGKSSGFSDRLAARFGSLAEKYGPEAAEVAAV